MDTEVFEVKHGLIDAFTLFDPTAALSTDAEHIERFVELDDINEHDYVAVKKHKLEVVGLEEDELPNWMKSFETFKAEVESSQRAALRWLENQED